MFCLVFLLKLVVLMIGMIWLDDIFLRVLFVICVIVLLM